MISMESLQETVLAKLKTLGSLVVIVGEEIREDDYQSANFTYPCVRVGLGEVLPASPECDNQERVLLPLRVFSKEPSSKQTLQIVDILTGGLKGVTLHSARIGTTTLRLARIAPPRRVETNAWEAIVEFATSAYEIGGS